MFSKVPFSFLRSSYTNICKYVPNIHFRSCNLRNYVTTQLCKSIHYVTSTLQIISILCFTIIFSSVLILLLDNYVIWLGNLNLCYLLMKARLSRTCDVIIEKVYFIIIDSFLFLFSKIFQSTHTTGQKLLIQTF